MEQARARMMRASNAPTNPNEGAPTDGNANAGYNTFWIDPGTQYGVVKGETRSSWIVDPPDGRIPYTAAAKKHLEDRLREGARHVGRAGDQAAGRALHCRLRIDGRAADDERALQQSLSDRADADPCGDHGRR